MSAYVIIYESPRQDYARFHAFTTGFDAVKAIAGKENTRLRRIFVRLQGAITGA